MRELRSGGLRSTLQLAAVRRQGVIAAGGLAGVAVTLGYNALLTGDPATFPYEAFAPRDGIGFGRRKLLDYERHYTPALALRANALALRELATEWLAGGIVGAALATGGAALAALRIAVPEQATNSEPARAGRHRLVLLGIVASVVVGNLYFWGTLNTLGDLGVPNDGLIGTHGPYYHFDLLPPAAIFAGYALTRLGDRTWSVLSHGVPDRRTRRVLGAGVLLVAAGVFGGAAVSTADGPIDRNRQVTAEHEAAYEPVLTRSFDRDLVFVPTPVGNWLAHPFQPFRNGPDIDGPVVYALDVRPFAVVDAYPDRRYHRYAYRGWWLPTDGEPVDARLQRVRHASGERVRLDATLGIPADSESVSLRLRGGDGAAYFIGTPTSAAGSGDRLPVRLQLTDGRARLAGSVAPVDNRSMVRLPRNGSVVLTAFVQRGTTGFSYRLEVPVKQATVAGSAREAGVVRALTPRVEVCRRPQRCGGEAAYVPRVATPGVGANVTLTASGAPAASAG